MCRLALQAPVQHTYVDDLLRMYIVIICFLSTIHPSTNYIMISSKGMCWRPRTANKTSTNHYNQRPTQYRAVPPQALPNKHSQQTDNDDDDVRLDEEDVNEGTSCLIINPINPISRTQLQNELQLRHKRLAVFVEFEQYTHAAKERDAIQALLLRERVNNSRTPSVLYPVGTVVRHRIKAFRGVIVGYDLHCRAPPDWIANNVDGLPNGCAQPFYHVLCDVRDQSSGEVLYVAQDNVVGVRRAAAARRPIEHPLITQYFIDYLEGSYIPNNSLRSRYPDDV